MLNPSAQGEKFPGGTAAFAQVGWLGQTGTVYALDGKPHESEPGGFQPLFLRVGHYVPVEDGSGIRIED